MHHLVLFGRSALGLSGSYLWASGTTAFATALLSSHAFVDLGPDAVPEQAFPLYSGELTLGLSQDLSEWITLQLELRAGGLGLTGGPAFKPFLVVYPGLQFRL